MKYFFLFSVGWCSVYLIAQILGASTLAALLFDAVDEWWGQVLMSALLLLACSVIFESMR